MERRRHGTRIVLLVILAALWLAVVAARLGCLGLFQYTYYLARARRQQQRIVEVSPRRGLLYDRNRRELAMSIQLDSCFAVPSEIADPGLAARLLSSALDAPSEEIETRLSSSKSFVWIARKLAPEKAAQIAALNLRGIYFQKEYQRFYPKSELAAHVLGYVDIDERGLGGIEYSFDEQLKSRASRMLVLTDARRRWFERREQKEENTTSLVLTLDEKLQYIAEKELATGIEQFHARAGTVVVEDPGTGELLAVANWPVFNANRPGASDPEARMDRAISALYEPGSTFKVVTLAAALEEGLTKPEEEIDCQMGAIYIGNHRIRDHKPFGVLTVAQVLAQSSDVGAIKLGLRLGAPKLHDYIRAFGFGSPTGIELPGETRGIVRRTENWSGISIGAVSMGQEIGVTPVQLVNAFSAIANGGLLNQPRVVRELHHNGLSVSRPVMPPRRAIRPETAATMRRLLEGVVLEGTGMKARLNGYTAGGKTGTAQKIDPVTGRYSRHEYIASFVGFAPVNNPAVTVLVAIDSPQGAYYGADVAAPVFQRVTQQTLAYLRVAPDVPISSPAASRPAGRQHEEERAAADLSDFDPVQIVDGGEAVFGAESAGTGATAPPTFSGAGDITVVLDQGDAIPVPRFDGVTVRYFIEECFRLGLNPTPVGTGVAWEQVPGPGMRVRPGSRIVVRFTQRASVQAVSQKGH